MGVTGRHGHAPSAPLVALWRPSTCARCCDLVSALHAREDGSICDVILSVVKDLSDFAVERLAEIFPRIHCTEYNAEACGASVTLSIEAALRSFFCHRSRNL